ncbi:MAG TPA: LytTR family DNA-binding domain-containing protein [Rudaea sp.]|nr:LytTR family DNA-binding domain-containing protein [Rudaea sp.]
MTIRTLIVDDEPLARRGLELRLKRHADIDIVGEAGNGREAFRAISALRPDLMFLDVQMPGVDGFGLLRALPASMLPLTVFVTAFDQYALAAFAASALDYLLKPVEDTRLDQAVDRARAQFAARSANDNCERLLKLLANLSQTPDLRLDDALNGDFDAPQPDKLAIRDGQRIVRVDVDAIRWIDAAGDYMCVHTAEATHVLRGTMHELEERLDPQRFQRVHRSTIVNLARVKELRPHQNGEFFLILDSGHEIKLSRSYKDKVKLLT